MKPNKNEIRVDIKAVRDVLHYDSESGAFWWKESRPPNRRGDHAGFVNKQGYEIIKVLGHAWKAHRLALFYVCGTPPKGIVDHINGVRNDNRISNLRDTSKLVNRHNWIKGPWGKNSRQNLRAEHSIPDWKPKPFGEELTQEFIRTMFNYDLGTGVFTWKKARATNIKIGMIAGKPHPQSKYIYINLSVGGKRYHLLAHRLAWLYVHGVLPKNQIDHINGVCGDNHISNLRDVTDAENKMNKWAKKNKTGFLGIYRDKNANRWYSSINVNGKRIRLGVFYKPELAHAAYIAAKKKYHGEFARAA